MKSMFPGYYRRTDAELKALWEQCTFVFDANILLHIYRYSPDLRDRLVHILERLKDRVWLPYQAAEEFHRNRLTVIAAQVEAFTTLELGITKARNSLESVFNEYKRHPSIDVTEYVKETTTFFDSLQSRLKEKREKHPDFRADDTLLERMSAIFEGKVGANFTEEELKKIYPVCEKRYSQKIPPGYMDVKKPDPEKYGDFVIWQSMLDFAKKAQKPVIYITDDAKEDWWLIDKADKTIGPRPELIQEFRQVTNTDFYMYGSDQFMKYAGTLLEEPVTQPLLDEAADLRKTFSAEPVDVAEAFHHGIGSLAYGKTLNWRDFSKRVTYNWDDFAEGVLAIQRIVKYLGTDIINTATDKDLSKAFLTLSNLSKDSQKFIDPALSDEALSHMRAGGFLNEAGLTPLGIKYIRKAAADDTGGSSD